jgi:hypothetical protein
MFTVVLRDRWCNIIVSSVLASSEEKNDYKKDTLYEELEQVFDYFHKYHMKILLGNFSAKLETRGYFQNDNWA